MEKKLLLLLELLNESDTVCLLQLYIISIGVLFNRTLIIVMLSATVVVKPCPIKNKDSKIALLASLLIPIMMPTPMSLWKS